MKFCFKCNGSGRIVVKATLSIYSGSLDYYPQDCTECQGNGYLLNKKLHQYSA